jgi:DNA-binding HxlR family transcriptional regulator
VTAESSAKAEAGREPKVCPHFHKAVEMVGKRWSGAILAAMVEGPRRFGEISERVPGMSDRLLSQRLREMEAEGLVERTVEAGSPVRVSYSLTEKGADLDPALRELRAWGRRWLAK